MGNLSFVEGDFLFKNIFNIDLLNNAITLKTFNQCDRIWRNFRHFGGIY